MRTAPDAVATRRPRESGVNARVVMRPEWPMSRRGGTVCDSAFRSQTWREPARVTVATQAALLLLHRKHDYYRGLRTVIIYPEPYFAPAQHKGVTGVPVEAHELRLGESWQAGRVVLAWSSVLHGAKNVSDAENVVFHEFAHQLDAEEPYSAGAPKLPERRTLFSRPKRPVFWATISWGPECA